MSWWEFGESRGYSGQELATYQIVARFARKKGISKSNIISKRRMLLAKN